MQTDSPTTDLSQAEMPLGEKLEARNQKSEVRLVQGAVLSGQPVTALRSGAKTSEFWITLLLILLTVASAVQGLVPPEHALAFATAIGAGYKILRLLLKGWQGHLDLWAYLAELGAESGTARVPEIPVEKWDRPAGAGRKDANEGGHTSARVLAAVALIGAALVCGGLYFFSSASGGESKQNTPTIETGGGRPSASNGTSQSRPSPARPVKCLASGEATPAPTLAERAEFCRRHFRAQQPMLEPRMDGDGLEWTDSETVVFVNGRALR